jgi:hypothetical protein
MAKTPRACVSCTAEELRFVQLLSRRSFVSQEISNRDSATPLIVADVLTTKMTVRRVSARSSLSLRPG